MRPTAFISGPIQGMETQQAYRESIRDACVAQGFDTIDPWQREKKIYRRLEYGWWNNVNAADFIKRDLEDIERSDLLIAYFPRLSAGTCMELFHAKLKGKTTISVCEIADPSPWIVFHSNIVLKGLGGLKETLAKISLVASDFRKGKYRI